MKRDLAVVPEDSERQLTVNMLSRVSGGELTFLSDLVDRALNGSTDNLHTDALQAISQGQGLSSPTKYIGFQIVRAARRLGTGGVTDQVAAKRQLAWLKGELAYLRPQIPAATGATNVPAADTAPADPTAKAIANVYKMAVERTPAPAEIDIWKNNFGNGLTFDNFVNLMIDSDEAKGKRQLLPEYSDGQFIQLVYEFFCQRGCTAREIQYWQQRLDAGEIGRGEILKQYFIGAFGQALRGTDDAPHDPYAFHVLGSTELVTYEDWKKKAQDLNTPNAAAASHDTYPNRFYIKSQPRILISAIASLYRGGKYIEQFMENICSQSVFDDYCELIIVDADSPENESQTIERYIKKHPGNIVYKRMNHRIGIYDAWNVGVELARGEYLTNTNLDDMRRKDSLEMQAAVLDNLPFVDVVYQDFYYTFDPDLSFEGIAAFDYKSRLPVITPYNLMDFNSPHNAPMWRKRLHDELGKFDISYKSAGDYEFWMRCLSANKCFYKVNDPLVVYYQNPEGLSTRADTRGVEEAKRILTTYARKLVSSNVVVPADEYQLRLAAPGLGGAGQGRYAVAQQALRHSAVQFKRGARRTQGAA